MTIKNFHLIIPDSNCDNKNKQIYIVENKIPDFNIYSMKSSFKVNFILRLINKYLLLIWITTHRFIDWNIFVQTISLHFLFEKHAINLRTFD